MSDFKVIICCDLSGKISLSDQNALKLIIINKEENELKWLNILLNVTNSIAFSRLVSQQTHVVLNNIIISDIHSIHLKSTQNHLKRLTQLFFFYFAF